MLESKKEIRYEIKYPIDIQEYRVLFSSLYANGIYPLRVYNDRKVNSIYFDTLKLDDYHDNVQGLANRNKYRLRWYDENQSQFQLERKNKINRFSYKSIYFPNVLKNTIPLDSKGVIDCFEPNLPGEVISEISKRLFQLYVVYERSYYEIFPGLRLTIDKDIKYSNSLCSSALIHPLDSPVKCVLEFKFNENVSDRVFNLLNGLPFRNFRHSKYVIGIDTTMV